MPGSCEFLTHTRVHLSALTLMWIMAITLAIGTQLEWNERVRRCEAVLHWANKAYFLLSMRSPPTTASPQALSHQPDPHPAGPARVVYSLLAVE